MSINSINNKPLKFLIDTGSNRSFISPNIAQFLKSRTIKPIEIKTIFDTKFVNKEIVLRGLPELYTQNHLTFLIFKFHNYFDGLIGIDIMRDLGLTIDMRNSTLKIRNISIPLNFKPNLISKAYTVSELSKSICLLPVDIESGSVYIEPTYIASDLMISEGLYEAANWYCLIEVVNKSNSQQTFVVEQPIRTQPINDFMEVHSYTIENSQNIEPTNVTPIIRTDHLNEEEEKAIKHLCYKYKDIFFQEGENLTFSNSIKHEIKTTDDVPIYSKSYRYPYVHKEEVQRQINDLLSQGIIRPSFSPWSSPIWIVPKKRDASGKNKWRLVIDYRKLNEKTIDDRYPIPNISDILDKLGKSIYFTTLDLASGFHQIEIKKEDIPKTAFSVENGHYEFLRMPFGLKNAPSTFQRVMDNVLKELQGKICLVYMDDIIVYSTSLQEHLENLNSVFEKLKVANLKIQINKSEFLCKEVSFLGHLVTPDGIKPNPEKISAVRKFPLPTTQKQIKSFLGLLGYYRKFIKDFANLTKPLTECLRKGNKICTDYKFISCFEHCKNLLCNDPILQYPDFQKPFIITTDASNVALGAVLSQGPLGSDRPICYASRTLSKSEQNYSTIERELLGIVWALKYFRPYVYGRKFKVVTDHKPLTWLFSVKDPCSKLIRWRLRLEEYDYEVVYKKGSQNSNADALSRIEINVNETEFENFETMSMQNNVDASSNASTIHSAQENLDTGIPISERAINEFSHQIIIRQNPSKSEISSKFQILFKRKKRYIIEHHNPANETVVTSILKDYLNTKRQTAILTDDDTFSVVQAVFTKFFHRSRTKLVRSTIFLKDITERDEQEKIVRDYHQNSNHRGMTECLLHLKRDIYFPTLKHVISKVINSCDICQRYKYDRNREKLKFEITETPSKPLEVIHIDIYSVHKTNFLTIIDKFSKFASAYALNARTSINLIKCLRHYFSHHGIPKKVVSDNGSEFVCTLFKEFLELYDIDFHNTCAKTSTGNSPVERFHSTLTELVRIIRAQKKDTTIEEVVDDAVLTYNNSIHSITKLSPFELLSGHIHTRQPFPSKPNFSTEQEYLDQHKKNYERLSKIIHDQSLNRKESYISKLNQSRKDPPSYDPNEKIFEKDDRRNKLAPRFNDHIVTQNNKITVETNKRKVHKQKIKNKKKQNANM